MISFNKKIILFTGLSLLLISGILTRHFIFLSDTKKLTLQKTLLESRQIALKELAQHYADTRSHFNTFLILSYTPLQSKEYIHDMEKDIENTKYILSTLQHGGAFVSTLHPNKVGLNTYSHAYQVHPFTSTQIAPLLASQQQIGIYKREIESFLNQFFNIDLGSMDYLTFTQVRTQLILEIKKQDAFFRRLFENLDHLFYLNQIELGEANQKFNTEQADYLYASRKRAAILLLLISTFALIAIRHVVRLNKNLKMRLDYDHLTGLKSRISLEDEAFGTHSIVFMVDVDDFSGVNSLYGTKFGDQLLREIAARLRDHCGQCTLYRFGGDIFALMSSDLRTTGLSVRKRIDFIENLIEKNSFTIQDKRLHAGITIGVGVGENAVARAMLALDMAKSEKKPYKIYSSRNHHNRRIKEQHQWREILNKALQQDNILPFIQPIVDAQGTIAHYECLMRLAQNDGDQTTYLPPTFLDTAKQLKLYPLLSRTTIRKAFERFSQDGSFSINLSYLDIKEPSTKHFLESLIQKHQVQGRVMFEILESEAIEDMEFVEKFLSHFRSLGVKIAIDDFGSHYSNLMEIIRFKPDYLKIDGSMIRDLSTDKDAQLAVRSISLFAKKLSIKTVAEFVHDQKTFELCRRMGIDYFQGYYFSPPVHHRSDIALDSSGKIIPTEPIVS